VDPVLALLYVSPVEPHPDDVATDDVNTIANLILAVAGVVHRDWVDWDGAGWVVVGWG
jgi:hypothetical protein